MFTIYQTDQRTNQRKRRRTLLLSGTITLTGVACAPLENDWVRAGTVRLEEAWSHTARLSRVRVYEDDGDLIVYGKVGRKAGVEGRVDAIVRVVVQLPDGRRLEETKRAFPPYLPIRRSRKSNFTVRFPELPRAGAVVRIECPPMPTNAPASSSPVTLIHDKEMRK